MNIFAHDEQLDRLRVSFDQISIRLADVKPVSETDHTYHFFEVIPHVFVTKGTGFVYSVCIFSTKYRGLIQGFTFAVQFCQLIFDRHNFGVYTRQG
ncbi:MAG: hypothetical protein K8S87_00470, partial [Planctomycetes bacterium]|nr:hypothetical protein [Planctomycetota bacterium]